MIRRLVRTGTEGRDGKSAGDMQELDFSVAEPEAIAIPTISEFTRRIAGLLEGEFSNVVIQGEISGWNRAASGHTYFTLKDETAVLGAVLWRSRTLEHPIRDGMKVVARGRITVYPPRGQYQLDCVSLAPLGLGELQLALEKLKTKLQAEGLFDAARKRRLPEFPKRIGVVTSGTGAAIRDILTTLRRRMPSVHVIVRPTLVQGAGAAQDIVLAIRQFNELEDVDLLIVGRGGGSIEDLWAFNEETVARAIVGSRIPVISAVGHEIDFTIADFVADMRAATPTAAAEIAVRDQAELLPVLRDIENAMHSLMAERIDSGRRELRSLLRSRGLSRPLDMVRSHQQRVDDLTYRTGLALRATALRSAERLRLLESTLQALNPMNVLARGYAIIESDGRPVSRVSALATGEHITLLMHDGRRNAIVEEEQDEG